MENNYKKINKKFWDKVYYSPNVESFVFRLKPRLLDLYIKQKKKLKVLDYGCGEGANIQYLIKEFGYDGYGVDIAKQSIKVCHKKMNKNKFKVIDFEVNQNDNFFKKKFDLIISIQTLYYLNDEDLKNRLVTFNKMLKPGGYVFFTMMSTKSKFYKYFSNKRKRNDGLYKVDVSSDKNFKKRNKQSIYYNYINFTKNEKDLKNKLRLFKPLNIGYYEQSLISTKEGGHHYTFFGKKK
jgi:SAM-dependent methyltransferase